MIPPTANCSAFHWHLNEAAALSSQSLSEKVNQAAAITFDLLLQKSDVFAARHPFPTQANLLKNLGTDKQLQKLLVENAQNTHPILHKSVLALINAFLEIKKSHGSLVEKQLYRNMNTEEFVDRLIQKRPLAFLTSRDYSLLRNGALVEGGFEWIGTDQERPPLCLQDYLSYDEMAISALIGMSVPTKFINNGWRNNRGNPASPGTFIDSGIYYGLVGARFEKPGLMEWRHMIITPEQNTSSLGYGAEAKRDFLLDSWAKFYGLSHFPSFSEVQADNSGNYIKIRENLYLNKAVFQQRMRKSIEPFLLDANQEAAKLGKKAYVHAVGIGLGAWLLTPEQGKLTIEVYKEIVSEYSLNHIADIDFSWFPEGSERAFEANEERVVNHVKFHFSKRNPAMNLPQEDKEKLLIAVYAWDSNSYPGNEYWLGNESLAASGDPAAACCSNIVELQNPEINPATAAKNTRYY